MTVIVKIDPVVCKVGNGWEAKVYGIDLLSGDPFKGELYHSTTGDNKKASWMYEGYVRDNPKFLNLTSGSLELNNLQKAAKALGGKLYP